MGVTPTPIDVHIDVMCPWAYRTSRWLAGLHDTGTIAVTWRFFSLEEINRREGKKHPWERPWSYGWSMMRIGALLRRLDPELLDRWYARAGQALHVEGRKPHHPDGAREILDELGLDPELVDRAIADETTHDDIHADHQRVLAAGGWGVPTLFFPDGQCLFGPVVLDPPKGDQAIRLWQHVCGWLEFSDLYEIQRPKGRADLDRIADRFRPYLEARDWVTISNPTP